MPRYRVVIRRGPGFDVKPEAEQTDGKVYTFEHGWHIEDDESRGGIYKGESAMIPYDCGYPSSAPAWVASGDLVREEDSCLK